MKLYADAGFTSADDKYATKAQIEVLPDQILSEVSETYATKDDLSAETTARTTAISQTNSAIALKANSSDVYTKTDTDGLISTEVTNRNAAIKAASDAINLSVSETYTTKNESKNAIDYVNGQQNNYGFQYTKDIIIYGDFDKYYPVYFTNLKSQYVTFEVLIMRGYNEQAPND